MPTGLHKTEQALARVRNRAVLPVLAVALRSSSAEIRAAAIRATIRRHDIESHTQLLRHFHELAPRDRSMLRETHTAMPHHAASALKAAVLEGDAVLCQNACDIILLCHDYSLFQALVNAVEKPRYPHAGRVVATLLQLTVQLHDEVISWAKGDHAGHDPSFARHQVLATLERSFKRKVDHHPSELVEAFLLLAPSDSELLMAMMQDAGHSCHSQLVSSLSSNKSPAVMERLVAILRDTDAPAAALEAIGRRADRPFVDFLLHELRHPVPLRVLHNMKRLRSVAWLEDQRDMLLEFDGSAQAIAIELATGSSIDRDALFKLLELVVRHGLAEGRRAGCYALAAFKQPEASELVLAALSDPDSGVQAAAVRQLRPRRIPEALQMLVARLESPYIEVRDAARSSLAEFNFVRYRAMFDLLDEQAVRTIGALVRQVDHSVRDKLLEELTSPSVTARLRGIEMAVAMGAVEDVRGQLLSLVRHENASVRKEAVAALAFATGAGVKEALDFALLDTNRSISDAARQSLARHKLSGTSLDEGAATTGLSNDATR